MTRIKICGIKTVEDALAAVDAGVDTIGLNFWKPGKRYIDPETAAEIVRNIPPFVTVTGVFLDSPIEEIRDIVEKTGLHEAQIHDAFSKDSTEASSFLKSTEQLDVKVIPVLRPQQREEIDSAIHQLRDVGLVEGPLLLDTPSKSLPGGTGKTFDWSLAVYAQQFCRVILAGGLTPKNVAEAVQIVRPYAVDTASGVEQSPGVKDTEAMRAFVRAVHEADLET